MNPYTENITSDESIVERLFEESTDSEDFMWHRDQEDRIVEAININNWQIQLEDQLPVNLRYGESITIPKETWHRVIKGTGIAIYKIKKQL
jgi:hypothetical protein